MDLIVQVRTNSTRLPLKILYKATKTKNFLEYFYDRVKLSKKLNRIIIATTDKKQDDIIEDICIQNDWLYFRGSENNVLKRFYKCAEKFDCKNIVRVTSDCPLVDYSIIDKMIDKYNNENLDFLTVFYHKTEHIRGFPDGFNPEIFNFNILCNAYINADNDFDREHVSPYMKRNNTLHEYILYVPKNLNINLKTLHLSLDTKEDLIHLRSIINNFESINYSYSDVLSYLNSL